MTFLKHEFMPTTVTIPAHKETRCFPCEHLVRTNILHSRLHGTSCTYVCKHPDAHEFGSLPADPVTAAKMGALRRRMAEHGREIGEHDRQPEWCPLKRKSA